MYAFIMNTYIFITLNLVSETEGTAILSCFQTHNRNSKKRPLRLLSAFFQ